MNRIMSAISAGVVAIVIGLASIVSSSAAPIAPATVQVTSAIEQAQYRDKRHDGWKGNDRHDNRGWDRHDRRRPHMESRGRPGYWNGHRGYRDHRRGYRRGPDGWWYPAPAFGIIIRP